MSEDVSEWLEELGLGQYSAAFAENGIEWDVLPDIDQETLKDIGVTRAGDRLRLIKAARAAHTEANPIEPEVLSNDAQESPARKSVQAERRQLTVMFCDLVGSTDLSGQLDPEDLREVVRAYQKTAEEVIQRYGGHIAQYLGDGLLVYFGYPSAHEDDAQRAVYAGIGIPQAITVLNTQLKVDYSINLSVRIGIHTGPVVVGEMGGNERQENLAMGETPNLAARLEGLAQPDTVVISGNTRHLLGELFALQALGAQNLKGIADPVEAFAVTGERLAETRFAAGHGDGASALVGRQHELALLLDRWRQARAGEGQMVVLSGEAGIGKSRIMSALVQAVAPEDHLRISYQCSPYHTDSALYPAIQHLRYAAGFAVNEPPEGRLNKLEALLRQGQDDIGLAVQLLGPLLGLVEVSQARYGSPDLTPQQQRTRTLAAIVDQLTGLAQKRPVLFVLEDAHWIDPTTLALIDLALDRIGRNRIMMLLTARPTFKNDFGGHPIVTRLTLNRLGRESIDGIVQRITKGKPVPAELIELIAIKTDGVPLFVEELTQSILESGALCETGNAYVVDGPLDRLAIPSTLHDSLMARLDRLQPLKAVAQMAACIGREFSFAVLSFVSPLSAPELTAALQDLVAAELIFRQGVELEATYTFKHALVRDAAYESLLKSQRQVIHAGLLNQFKTDAEAAPEILAHHATEAARGAEAADYWEQAGDQAMARPAFSEAISLYERANGCLKALDGGDNNRGRQLDVLVKLARASVARFGWAHPATVRVNGLALALLDVVVESPHWFGIQTTNWVAHHVAADCQGALDAAIVICLEADRRGDARQKLSAYSARATSKSAMGELREADDDFERALAFYDPGRGKSVAPDSSLDPEMTARTQWALNLQWRGQGQKAWALVANLEDEAREFGRVTHYVAALDGLGRLHVEGRVPGGFRIVQLQIDLAEKYELKLYQELALVQRGLLLGIENKHREAAEQLGRGLARKSHNKLGQAAYYAWYAYSLAALGRQSEAAEATRTALTMINNGSEQVSGSEIHRLLADSQYWHRNDAEKAINGLRRALEIADQQDARLFELRGAVSLARIWADQGERTRALEFLNPFVERFPVGGRDLPDMADAVALQRELT